MCGRYAKELTKLSVCAQLYLLKVWETFVSFVDILGREPNLNSGELGNGFIENVCGIVSIAHNRIISRNIHVRHYVNCIARNVFCVAMELWSCTKWYILDKINNKSCSDTYWCPVCSVQVHCPRKRSIRKQFQSSKHFSLFYRIHLNVLSAIQVLFGHISVSVERFGRHWIENMERKFSHSFIDTSHTVKNIWFTVEYWPIHQWLFHSFFLIFSNENKLRCCHVIPSNLLNLSLSTCNEWWG